MIENKTIDERLSRIEVLLNSYSKEVLTFTEFCRYCGISKSFGYKLTSTGRVPHYKPAGKMMYFHKSEIDNWLMKNPIKTASQIEAEASTYVTLNKGVV